MRQVYLAYAMLIVGMASGPAHSQRLDPPGSVAEGGKLNIISSQSIATRCKKDRYRSKAKVECARSDAYQTEQAKRRSNRG